MSFILDAIKKSERERQRSKQPDVFSLQDAGMAGDQHGSQRSKPIKLLVAVVICGTIGWWLWPGITEQFGKPALQRFELPGANEAVVRDAETEDAPADLVGAARIETLPATVYAGADSLAEEGTAVLPPRHLIKDLWEQPADFQSTVPDMEFSFHVFSKNPDKRTIIINGRRLREGQMVASGLKLHVITSTGVILHYKNRYFHVDVVEKW